MVSRLNIGIALQQQTADFKVATKSRQMQWSFPTEYKKTQTRKQNPGSKKMQAINHLVQSLASTSASHCSSRRQISRWP
jgi:hypothetical protein